MSRYRCSPGQVFVWAFDPGYNVPFPVKKWRTLVKRKDSIIKCDHCHKAAVRVDYDWPYFTGYNACAEHMDAEPRE